MGDVAKIIGGGTPSTKIKEYWNGNINWYSPIEIGKQTFVSSSRKKISELGLKKSSAKLLPGGNTILFTSRAGIGDMAIMKTAGSTNQGFQSWVVRSNLADVYFLYSVGKKLKKQALRKASGSTFLEISNSEVKKLSLLLPSLREQKEIGKIFKLIDKLLSLQQRKLEQIKLLKKAMLQKLLAETDNPYPKLRFFGFSNTWKKYTVNSLFKISRGYVLSTALTEANKSAHNPYPVYSSQTKNNGLMGYYNKYLYENAITWTTDGANAGTVNYRSGKFYCTNVCGVILSDKVDANQLIAEELNTVSKRYVSYVGNPKLMNNVMANIKIIIPDQYKERQQISQLFSRQDVFKDVYQRKQNVLKILKQFLLQNMFI